METLEARFVGAFIDRLASLENQVAKQADEIDRLKRQTERPPAVLEATNITSEIKAFSDGTAIHWGLGQPPGMYVDNKLEPLAPPYSEVIVGRGPLSVCVSRRHRPGLEFMVLVSSGVGRITLGTLIARINQRLNDDPLAEDMCGRGVWQLKQKVYCLDLIVD